MKKIVLFFLFSYMSLFSFAQMQRPKLVVGIVVDQMRWDYLYRFYDKYSEGGFKRLLNEGYSCANTFVNYLPAYTAVGHSTIFTGSVPSIDGIAGNSWRFQNSEKTTYCTDDSTVSTVGAVGGAGEMSPHNLWVTTITDELRLATNFKSKVIGVSLKDRAAILPAGHNPTGAFWLDDSSGNFITSTYYMKELPIWVKVFNEEKNIDKLIKRSWKPLLSIDQYTESTKDDEPWEGKLKGSATPTFPFDVAKAYSIDKESFRQTPYGNTLTLNFAEAAINGEKLGQGNYTDFLTINCASTDYVGHMTGPNAIEIEDVYLRLDRDLATFLDMLDAKVGKGNYLIFLTADHGGAHSEGFMKERKMPTGFFPNLTMALNEYLQKEFGVNKLVLDIENFEVSFDNRNIESNQLNKEKIKAATIVFLQKQKGILYAIDESRAVTAPIPSSIREMIINGYNRERSGDIKIILQSGWLPDNYKTGTSHGLWNAYDTHIPLIFMGWKIPHGETNSTNYMTDIAPTIAALLHIQMPSGCIGKAIVSLTDIVKK
ncbi:alkaline phosphatase PafA [Arachidicoccus sp.]|uniref:alkaline phosphatase PafA n=1 Tax=Arachidicoccus sp. TaxID=1872624 RepID=UPI003D1DE59F